MLNAQCSKIKRLCARQLRGFLPGLVICCGLLIIPSKAADSTDSATAKLKPAEERIISVLKSIDQYAPNVRAEWRRWQLIQLKSQNGSMEKFAADFQKLQKKPGIKPEQLILYGAMVGEVYYLDYRTKDAEAMLRWAETSLAKLATKNPLMLANIQADIAQICLDDGRYAEAEKLLRKILLVLPTNNLDGMKDPAIAGMGFLPARYLGIARTIARVPSNKLLEGADMSPLNLAARLSSAPSAPTINLASVHLALSRIYFRQQKLPQAINEYSEYLRLSDKS